MTSRRPRKTPSVQKDHEIEKNIERAIELEKAIGEIAEAIEVTGPLIDNLEKVVETQKSSGKVFLSDEDRRILKKFNRFIVNKLGISGNRSFRI